MLYNLNDEHVNFNVFAIIDAIVFQGLSSQRTVYSGLVEDANSLLAETREEHDEEHAKEIVDLYHPVEQHDSPEHTGQYPAGYHSDLLINLVFRPFFDSSRE